MYVKKEMVKETMEEKKKNTKERILLESLKLFSTNGFEAVSIRTIAAMVGIGNSALYKHFASKQAIFDAIVELSKERYLDQCTNVVTSEIRGIEQLKGICLNMFRYQTSDEWTVMFRKMLMIEQFRNAKMAAIYKEFFVDIPLKRQIEIFKKLMEYGLMKNKNAEVLAMELYAPFYMYHTVWRDENELTELFETHAEYFFDNYINKEENEK